MKHSLISFALVAMIPMAAAAQDAIDPAVIVKNGTIGEVRAEAVRSARLLQLTYEDYEATEEELKSFKKEMWGLEVEDEKNYISNNWTAGKPEHFKLKMVMRIARRLNGMQDLVHRRFEATRDSYCNKTVETTDFAGEEFTTTTYTPKADTPEDRASVFCVSQIGRIVPFS